jgi:hypothetical protein
MKIGDMYPVWWWQPRKDEQGRNLARIINIEPYKGRYPELFSQVLTLTADTKSGQLEMAI